jgi:Domain of unknown function (DUF4091)/Spherulation-specific family 4
MALKQYAVAVAYFDLSRQADWGAIVAGGPKVRLAIPDGSFRNPPDLSAARQEFASCQRQGQLVLGYVFTGAGDRDPNQVNSEIDEWATNYGAAINGFYLDSGIELDIGKTDQDFQNYYRPLIAGLRSRHPGSTVGLAASQYKYSWVIEIADFATIWEGAAADYLDPNKYLAIGEQHLEPPPAWWSANPLQVIATVVQTPQNQVGQVLTTSQSRNTGNLYVFDDTTANYGHLSKWWNDELNGLAGWGMPLSLTAGLAIAPATPTAGQPFMASYTVTNTGGQPLTVPVLFVGARDPSGANADFGYVSNVTLQPGQPYAFQQPHTFDNTGTYSAWPAAYIDGVYQAIDPAAPPAQFTVQQAAISQVTVVGPLVAVRPSDDPGGVEQAELIAARNEFESFQIVIRAGAADVHNVSINLSMALSGPGTIPANNLTIYREDYYQVAVPSDTEGAAGPWPDALIPANVPWLDQQRSNAFPLDVPAGENRVAWIDILVPADASVGTYSGALGVTSDSFAVTIPIRLTVFDATLPSTASLSSIFDIGWNDVCQARYGTTCFDAATEAEGWRLNALLARIALDNRISIASAQYQPLSGGNVALFRQHLLPLLNGTAATRLPGAKLTSFQVDPGTVAEWKNEADQQGFADRAFLYACDEPDDNAAKWQACQTAADQAHQQWGDLPILVTATIEEASSAKATGYVNWLVCIVNFMDDKSGNSRYTGDQRSTYNDFLALNPSNRLWLYTSCMSHGCVTGEECLANPPGPGSTNPYFEGWPGYVIDEPPSKARAMGWMCYLYQASGELYFDATHCLSTAWTAQYAYGGNGDGTLFYPGDPARTGLNDWTPLESLRLKRIRDGYEDYEYLRILTDRGQGDQAQAIAGGLFENMYNANQSDAAVQAARRQLAHLIDPATIS